MNTSPSRHHERKLWLRYVAVGDSFSEGMSDAHPSRADTYVGWADRLAAHLSDEAAKAGQDFGYANLAIRGRLLADIAGRQVTEALALQPDLVSIVGGGNDILRPKADIDALAATLEDAVARVRATGANVLLATPTDPKGAPLVGMTRGRVGIYIAHLWSIARKHDAYVLDQWSMRSLTDWRLWADDRIHMTSEGHRRVALAAFQALGFEPDDPDWDSRLPPSPPSSRSEAAREHASWARDHLGPWVGRRMRGESSGDAVAAKRPDLLPLPPRE